MKKVLTIAGSDSGAGAGIQADLKTFAAFGVYGTTAITAITAQNTQGVIALFVLPTDIIAHQIDAVMVDIGADVWKVGMLANAKNIDLIVEKSRFYKIKSVVVDPVMVAKGGSLLLAPDARRDLIKKLIPISLVITPNCFEAEILTGNQVNTP